MVDILHRIGIKGSLDAVYRAIATREGVAGWWTKRVEGQSKVGETLHFHFVTAAGKEVGVIDLKVLALDAGRRVVWQGVQEPAEWKDTKIAFELKEEDGYVIVLFRHEGWKEPVEFMNHCSTKWATFLMSLKSLVETGHGAPSPDDVQISNWH
jgi:uncharacterized protein YndB with AHSA1/START domain